MHGIIDDDLLVYSKVPFIIKYFSLCNHNLGSPRRPKETNSLRGTGGDRLDPSGGRHQPIT